MKKFATLVLFFAATFLFNNASKAACLQPNLGWNLAPTLAYQTIYIGANYNYYGQFTAVAGGVYTFTNCSNGGYYNYDTYLYLTDGANNVLVGADDQCGVGSQIVWTCPTSGTYRIHPTSYSGCINGSDANLAYNVVLPFPANDACNNAINIGTSLPYTSAVINNANATDDYTTSSCDGPYRNVWWTVTGPSCINTLTASTCLSGTNFDNEIAVFTGGCGGFTQVTCNDDNGPGCGGTQASVNWASTPGTVYYISVGSYCNGCATGNLQLNVTGSGDATGPALDAISVTNYSNGAGGTFTYAPGASDQAIALAACESVYGVGNCNIGSCGNFTYYKATAHLGCDCNKPVGQYEFIYSNTGYTQVGQDYGGAATNVTGNKLFTRVKSSSGCTGNSWTLTEPNLGQSGGSTCWITDDRHVYPITARATDASGIGGSTYGILALVNYQGSNAGNYGGYFAWNTSLATLNAGGFTADQCEAAGGGYVGKYPSAYGYNTNTLVGGTTYLVGNQRTVIFSVRPNSAFPVSTVNAISLYSQDACGNAAGWSNFQLNFSTQTQQLITMPANVTVCGGPQVVNYSTPTSTCNTTVVRNAGLASGSTFPLGVNTVTWNTYYPNGAGGSFTYAPGATNQQIALAACESVYGAGNCSIGGCGYFTYYYQTGAQQCDCSKRVGSYEFIYSNTGYTQVGQDYGGKSTDVTGNQLFTRVKTSSGCDGNSWSLAEPALGQGGASGSFTVTVNNLSATVGVTNVTCNGGNNGVVSANATGGAAPYTYAWSGGGTAAIKTGCAAGTYTVTVTSASGCSVAASGTVAQPAAIGLSTAITNASCLGVCDGAVNLTVSGGTPSAKQPNAAGLSSNLVLWANGDNGVIRDVSAGTQQWSDLSGLGNNITQASAGNRPSYVASAINGKPVLRFNTAQYMTTATSFGTPYTIFTITKMNNGSDSRLISSASTNWLMGNWGGNQDVMYANGWVSPASGPTPDNLPHMYAATGTGALTTFYDFGNTLYSNAGGVSGFGQLQLNGWSNGLNEMSDADVAEVIVYNRVLTATELQGVRNYLAAKYAVAGSGGSAYTYNWSNGATTEDVSSLCASTFTVTVTDANGCTASTSPVVPTTTDVTLPTISGCPANINVFTTSGCTGVATWTAPTATDNCGVTSFTSSHASGAPFPIGATTVTYTARDAANNVRTCSFTVTVIDNVPPTISGCPANINVFTTSGCTGVATWTAPTASDNCGVTSFTSSHASGATFPIGATTVTYTARDAANNVGNCSFTVTVIDNVLPNITCPANVSVFTTSGCTGVATWTAPTASDNCGVTSFTSSHASGATFPIGATTVTYTARDAANNVRTCSFTVTVIDNEAPNITTCPGNQTVTVASNCQATIPDFAAITVATDNCAGSLVYTQSPLAGTYAAYGTNAVTITVKDAANNQTTCGTNFIYTAPSDIVAASSSNTCVFSGNNTGEKFLVDAATNEALLSINDGTVNLGTVTASVTKNGGVPAIAGSVQCDAPLPSVGPVGGDELYLPREFDVTTSNAPSGYVTVSLYFTQAELTALANATTSASAAYQSCWGTVAGNGSNLMLTIHHSDNTYETRTQGGGGLTIASTGGPNGTYKASFQVNKFSGFQFHGNGGVNGANGLPVQMLYFTANEVNNTYIRLDWATALEINNDGFWVERSTDGVNWTSLAWIDGHDNSTVTNAYNYDDHAVASNVLYYYRLKQVDNDGESEYSAIETAQLTGGESFAVSEFIPNPTNAATRLVISSSYEQNISVSIFDIIGQKVTEQSQNIAPGTSQFEFDFATLASGTYTAIISTGNKTYSKKLVVTR